MKLIKIKHFSDNLTILHSTVLSLKSIHYTNAKVILVGDTGVGKSGLGLTRADRGGISVSRARIDSLVKELDFDGYFETSAKEDQNIKELAEAIREGIDWESLPKVSSTELF